MRGSIYSSGDTSASFAPYQEKLKDDQLLTVRTPCIRSWSLFIALIFWTKKQANIISSESETCLSFHTQHVQLRTSSWGKFFTEKESVQSILVLILRKFQRVRLKMEYRFYKSVPNLFLICIGLAVHIHQKISFLVSLHDPTRVNSTEWSFTIFWPGL